MSFASSGANTSQLCREKPDDFSEFPFLRTGPLIECEPKKSLVRASVAAETTVRRSPYTPLPDLDRF